MWYSWPDLQWVQFSGHFYLIYFLYAKLTMENKNDNNNNTLLCAYMFHWTLFNELCCIWEIFSNTFLKTFSPKNPINHKPIYFVWTLYRPKIKQTTLIIHPPTVKQLNAAEYWSPVCLIFVHVFQYKCILQQEYNE